MHTLPSACPFCGGAISVTRLHCQDCDLTIEGRFSSGPFARLTGEHLDFIALFVRCEGKINRMENELNLSYPTIRSRLQEVIRAMGFEPGGEEAPKPRSEGERQGILEDLDAGRLTVEQAMRLLQEKAG
ncbi:MAG: DUF2089 domain-containing protein [Chloroflexi bacterium]|nr:DUF2089 domain-containing protein [Chloroflexota bacterium]